MGSNGFVNVSTLGNTARNITTSDLSQKDHVNTELLFL
jgi:hypothetical protein